MIKRTALTINNLNEKVELKGWVSKSRRLGDLVFVDLRNARGITQIVFEKDNSFIELAKELRPEYVVSIIGTVVERKSKNPELESGEIEIIASDLKIINKAKTSPMIIANDTDALEHTRMEYRYLDIRRENVINSLIMRSKMNKIIRDHFEDEKFLEVETPVITKPTPGGAGELKVRSSHHEGMEYSLVQSPQIYKQLLMYGGVEGYYQIARCFRDEKGRGDRQLEFTQLDIEKSFTTPEEIQKTIEILLKKIVKEIRGEEIKTPFLKMTFHEAMEKYGSDKPDIRFENLIFELTKDLKNTPVNFIQSSIESGKSVQAVAFTNDVSNGFVKKLEEKMKSQGASGLAWARIENSKVAKGTLKALTLEEIKAISSKVKETDFTIFMIIDELYLAQELIGRVRLELGNKFRLIDENKLSFLWVIDWPQFELNSERNIDSMHNPFTAPKNVEEFMNIDINDKQSLLSVIANSYDIVLNGSEIGGGSIRITNTELQDKTFKAMGINDKEKEENFGWFLNAMKYGIPQHGGIALGLDRILAILLKYESIKDVIAFPKSTSGTDEMSKAPVNIK